MGILDFTISFENKFGTNLDSKFKLDLKIERERNRKEKNKTNQPNWAPTLYSAHYPFPTAQPRSSISIPRALQLSRGPHRSVAWYRNCAIVAVWRAHASAGVFGDLALASLSVEPTAQSHLPGSRPNTEPRRIPCSSLPLTGEWAASSATFLLCVRYALVCGPGTSVAPSTTTTD
jgi:hypothetical protein